MAKRKTLAKKGRKNRKTRRNLLKGGRDWFTSKKKLEQPVKIISDKQSAINDIESQIKGTLNFCSSGGVLKDIEGRKRDIKEMIKNAFNHFYIDDDEADKYDEQVNQLKC
jgi:hypothetical protein